MTPGSRKVLLRGRDGNLAYLVGAELHLLDLISPLADYFVEVNPSDKVYRITKDSLTELEIDRSFPSSYSTLKFSVKFVRPGQWEEAPTLNNSELLKAQSMLDTDSREHPEIYFSYEE